MSAALSMFRDAMTPAGTVRTRQGWRSLFTLRDQVSRHGVPMWLLGLPVGHVEDLVTVPLGTRAHLNIDRRRLTVESPSGG